MQFVKDGPDIPELLLEMHEDGRTVLFCGAGVSYPAGLPGFKGLVEKIYSGLALEPNDVERAAIRTDQYDTAIGLLEGRLADGRAVVRGQLKAILQPDLSALAPAALDRALATHDALLTLGRNRKGRHRLVTTNFDHLFAAVISRRNVGVRTYEAPLLPVPKNRWDGLVYLHGLLPDSEGNANLDHLVVSSGDFGLAYLTERWAARFVGELFRNYTVCFVGYSINDPVLRYMMDALAADRLRGESPSEVFAFGSYSKGREMQTANEWKAKNVTPILYREHRNHAYLHRTLCSWAETYRDGVLGKERIVAEHAVTKPLGSTKQDDFVGRVLWALSDPSALPAKRFAELDPAPPLDWLEPLAGLRFAHRDLVRFGVAANAKEDEKLRFSFVSRPTPYRLAPQMVLTGANYTAGSQWDDVMFQLGRWLIRHLHDPKLILWVAKQGGALHDRFAQLVASALEKDPPSTAMYALWRIVLSGRLEKRSSHFDLFDWQRAFKRDGLTPTLRLQLRKLLSPHVRLAEPFPIAAGEDQGEGAEVRQIRQLVDWEIVLSGDYLRSALEDAAKDVRWRQALPTLLSDATTLLGDALDLMRELGGADDRHDSSYWHQPSISVHAQNQGFHDWTVLIELVREAWLATVANSPERARLEVQYWLAKPYPLFRRLAFFAGTASSLFTTHELLLWLLADEAWWLWAVETEREAIRLLVKLAPTMEPVYRADLETAILQGPPRTMFRGDIEPEQLQRIVGREVWLRLAKYRGAGGELGGDAAARLEALSQQYPMWYLAEDERDEFPVWTGDGEDSRQFHTTPKRLRDLVTWLREHPTSDAWEGDDWRDRCKRDFRRTAAALMHLARHEEWFSERWREGLQAWGEETLAARSWRWVGTLLATASDGIVRDLAHTFGSWLQVVAKTFIGGEAAFFTLIRRMLALFREEHVGDDDDPVARAINHPIGHVTEAALNWWYRQGLQDGQGLAYTLEPIFSDVCDTSVASFRHGRVILAAHVISLFRVDRPWATRYLLPLFDWQRSLPEARAAWEGFLWSPRLYPPMIEMIKPQFLATAEQYANLGRHDKQYAALLTFAALDPAGMFSTRELAAATRALPPDGLHHAAHTLVRALDGSGDQRREYWRNRVLPYLRTVWPKANEAITPAVSEALARLCIVARDDFPQAQNELARWLRPVEHPGYLVHLLLQSDLCKRFPADSLAFLDVVVGENVQWAQGDLRACLDAILEIQPVLETDPRARRLGDYLRR